MDCSILVQSAVPTNWLVLMSRREFFSGCRIRKPTPLSLGMSWRADKHCEAIRTERHRRLLQGVRIIHVLSSGEPNPQRMRSPVCHVRVEHRVHLAGTPKLPDRSLNLASGLRLAPQVLETLASVLGTGELGGQVSEQGAHQFLIYFHSH